MPARLPNADHAFVEPEKLANYLLDADHPEGGPKWRFLKRFGFQIDQPDTLEASLLAYARQNDFSFQISTPYGEKFEIDGPLVSPDGRLPTVRTVWIIDTGTDALRFVTMKPI